MGLLLQQWGARTKNRFPCFLLPRWGQVPSLYVVRVGVGPGVGLEGRLRCFPHPLGVLYTGDILSSLPASQHLAFVPCSSKGAPVFSGLSVSLGFRICPNCTCTQPFLVPRSFPVFCHSRRGVFRCKHCSKGSQVPTCLMSNFPLFAVHPSPSPTTYVPPYNQEGQKDDEAVVWRIIQQAVRVQEL